MVGIMYSDVSSHTNSLPIAIYIYIYCNTRSVPFCTVYVLCGSKMREYKIFYSFFLSATSFTIKSEDEIPTVGLMVWQLTTPETVTLEING